jgi:hypothetical protein
MPEGAKQANWLLGLLGAAAGGAAGYFLFFLLTREGFYGLILPGAALGLGCGALLGGKSNAVGAACGVLALLLGIFTEWRFAPFIVDDSLWFFIAHLHELTLTTLVSIAVGGLFAFWFGRGREGGAWPRHGKGTVEAESPPS